MKIIVLTASLFVCVIGVFCQSPESGCPTISVMGPVGVTAVGEALFFKADVYGEPKQHSLSYKWTVSEGEITDGQNTDLIRVVSNIGGANIKASVKIIGLPKQCENSASETAPVAVRHSAEPIDDYGEIPWDEERARLDNIWITLANNPNSQAFFFIKITEKETNDDAKKHIIEVLKHFKFRDPDFDRGRLVFVIEKSEFHSTVVGVFSDGAERPDCKDCEIINGKHVYF